MGRRSNGEGSIYKRKDNRWVGKYTLNGKRKCIYGRTRKEVAQKLLEAMTKHQGGFSSGSDLTVQDYLEQWLEDSVRHSVRPRTWERYEEITRKHITPEVGKIRLDKLTPNHVQSLYCRKLDSGSSPRTVQYVHVTLHKALGQAVRWNLLPFNVTQAVTPPIVQKKEVCPLDPEQVKIFFKAIERDRLEAMFILAVTTGLRQGELLGLKWEDIDLDINMVRVKRTLSKSNRTLIFAPPKSAKGKRNVHLTNLAIKALKEHRTLQDPERTYWKEDCGLVFPNTDGRPRSSRGYLTESLKRILKRASLPEIRFHDLRHTAATLLLTKGVHPKIVQELLGHSTISITLDTYSHVLPNMQREAVRAMEDIFD